MARHSWIALVALVACARPSQQRSPSESVPLPSQAEGPSKPSSPQEAFARAIALLEQRHHARFLEELTLPSDLHAMRTSGELATTLQALDKGWGQTLAASLRRARSRPPNRRADGALEFDA